MSRRADEAAEPVVTAGPVATTEPVAFADFYRENFADAARLAFLLPVPRRRGDRRRHAGAPRPARAQRPAAGRAVLVDGIWKMTRGTICVDLSVAGVECLG